MFWQGVDMKYIDPSYQIRAVPTNCNDRIYCKVGRRLLTLSADLRHSNQHRIQDPASLCQPCQLFSSPLEQLRVKHEMRTRSVLLPVQLPGCFGPCKGVDQGIIWQTQ